MDWNQSTMYEQRVRFILEVQQRTFSFAEWKRGRAHLLAGPSCDRADHELRGCYLWEDRWGADDRHSQ